MDIHLKLNGASVVWQAHPGANLLEVLRERGLLSVKQGCREGDCGCCTILVDGSAVRACLMLVGQVEGRTVATVEGLGTPDSPHPLQESFVRAGAVQCGFCTPGMLLAAKALLDEAPRPGEKDVREALDGNLCRCTGYKKIIEAVLSAAERMHP